MPRIRKYCFYKDKEGQRILRVVWYKGNATKEELERLENKPLEWFKR